MKPKMAKPYMDDGIKMIMFIYRCVPSLIHICTEKYHKVSSAYHKVNEAKCRPNPFMDSGDEMILSLCNHVPSIIVLTHMQTEK